MTKISRMTATAEGFDPDEAYGEPEYLSEDDFDDRIDDEQEDSE